MALPLPPRSVSILIPVFNEITTVGTLLDQVLAAPVCGLAKEVLVCDDGSTDGTRDLLTALPASPELRVELLEENVGRGGVLKYLWGEAGGDVLVHQDADLEYDPRDIAALLAPIVAGEADVVYGSRFRGSIERMRGANEWGNRFLTWTTRRLYGIECSDLMTCYKSYRRELVEGLDLGADGFDFEAELTARLAQRGARFAEVPIRFVGRTHAEGKKIRAVDAVHVLRRLLVCRVRRKGAP